MRRGRFLGAAAACAAMAIGGCASPAGEVRVDPVIAGEVLNSAATQVRRCYRSPRVTSAAKQIVTRVAIRLNADGTLAELPAVVGQTGITPENRVDAPRMAEAATLAVIRCAPLRLPSEHYGGVWDRIELVFSPRRAV